MTADTISTIEKTRSAPSGGTQQAIGGIDWIIITSSLEAMTISPLKFSSDWNRPMTDFKFNIGERVRVKPEFTIDSRWVNNYGIWYGFWHGSQRITIREDDLEKVDDRLHHHSQEITGKN